MLINEIISPYKIFYVTENSKSFRLLIENRKVIFKYSPEYASSIEKKLSYYSKLLEKIAEFKKVKSIDPLQPYGVDKFFVKNTPLAIIIPRIREANLGNNARLVYRLVGDGANTIIQMFGVFDHDYLGTGHGGQKRQEGVAKHFLGIIGDMTTEEPYIEPPKEKTEPDKKTGPNPQYAQKAKSQQPLSRDERINLTLNKLETILPKSTFKDAYLKATSDEGRINLIKKEAFKIKDYIVRERDPRNKKMLEDYFDGLNLIYKLLVK